MKLELGHLYEISGITCMLLGFSGTNSVENVIYTFVFNYCDTGYYKYTQIAVMTKRELTSIIIQDLISIRILAFMPVIFMGKPYDDNYLIMPKDESDILESKEQITFNRKLYMLKSKVVNPCTPLYITEEDFKNMSDQIMQKFMVFREKYDFNKAFHFFKEDLILNDENLFFNKIDKHFYVYCDCGFHLVNLNYNKELHSLKDLFRLRYLAEKNIDNRQKEVIALNKNDLLMCSYFV